MTKSSLWRKEFIFACIIKEVRAGTQGRNLEAGAEVEAIVGAAYRFAPHGLFSCFLIAPRTTSSGVALPTVVPKVGTAPPPVHYLPSNFGDNTFTVPKFSRSLSCFGGFMP